MMAADPWARPLQFAQQGLSDSLMGSRFAAQQINELERQRAQRAYGRGLGGLLSPNRMRNPGKPSSFREELQKETDEWLKE